MFKIKTLRVDDEYDMQIRVSLIAEFCSCSLDFYIGGNEEFKTFAEELKDFPFRGKKEIEFVYGEDNSRWAHYLKIGVNLIDGSGRSVIKVIMDNKGEVDENYRCEFPINTDVHTLNRLGQKLSEWKPIEGEIWSFE
ncbi:hypothetical protein SAMN05216474_0356 [Lishizhenia tianjinensis]|uniref:Uncharacterized protein n=1 Tax=Lishizhenia tianjinensis TaxID=477690 RepID=A0A1I6XP51_9FLAO|nr:hypothetical protein [Lishizhenia tianjinensis]SFT40148.1 hypothetical protein SAMN05216474_0356 [Lishizhenia tianjinensis]